MPDVERWEYSGLDAVSRHRKGVLLVRKTLVRTEVVIYRRDAGGAKCRNSGREGGF